MIPCLELDQAHNPNCTTIGSAIFAQVTAECRYTLQWATFSPKLPLPTGIWTPIKHTIPWTHPSSQIKQHLYRFSRFCTNDRIECPYTLQWDVPFPLEIATSHGGIWTAI